MLILILGLIIFLGIHSVQIFAPRFRDSQVASRGMGAWKGIYSLAALIGLVLIVWGYGIARQTAPILYEPPLWTRHLNLLLMYFAFVFIVSSQFPAGRIKAALKHPMLVAVKVWALGHLLANGDLAALLLFGTFLVWAVLDRISVKRRGEGGPVAGPVKWDIVSIGVGTVLYLLFVFYLHEWLIGVSVVA